MFFQEIKVNYPEFVRSRVKSGEKIAEEMTPEKAAVIQRRLNLVVHQSVALDLAKKQTIYNKHQGLYAMAEDAHRLKDFKPTPSQCELLHAAIGIAGEAGELLDAVRKHVFDGQPLDGDNIIEELGDLCFYLEAAMQAIKMKRADIEELNMAKLSERYKDGYSDQQAQERKDKQ
jgi:NTP pyrophosphatase (non-canonical NTP hydrolase)